jgi:hypothetical protein
MEKNSIAYVALDTSKLHNAIAIAAEGRDGEVRYLGEIDNTPAATGKPVRKLAKRHAAVTFCYEAGPTGYGLYRQITGLGHECIVVAPSLIPQWPGDRVKTNRRDALSLAKQLRAGDLTAVWVPEPHHEAVRDLTRARGAAARDLRPAGAGDPGGAAGLVARAHGDRTDGIAWHRPDRCHQLAGGDRRSDTLRLATRADGLARHGAFGELHRRACQAWCDHQGGQSPRAQHAGGMRLELSSSAARGRRQAG